MIKAFKPRSPRCGREGFTLIELLVVIAIIALLAAILFPVFARARENARKSSCQNNLKQLAIGVLQYTQDYDEAFPFAWGGNVCWWQEIHPYIKSTQVFQCPSDSSTALNTFPAAVPPAGYVDGRTFHLSYGVNYPLFGNGSNASTMAFNSADMPKPAQVVMISDTGITAAATGPVGGGNWIGTSTTNKRNTWLIADPTCTNANAAKPCNAGASSSVGSTGDTNWSAANPRHLDTVNTVFADGHVKSTRTDAWYYGDSNWMNPRVGGP